MPELPIDPVPVIDVHAHLFPRGLPDLTIRSGDRRWPVLDVDGDDARVVVAGAAVRRAGRTLWDVPARIAALDAAGVDVQVVSPVPVTLVPWAPAPLAAEWCAALNGALAKAVSRSGGRLLGLGAVPLGPGKASVDTAVAEARRIRDRGLVGLELPTLPGDRELDDPELEPFWAAVAELELPLLVHPTDPGATRRSGQPYQAGVGMLTDTGLAGTALVFGEVLDAYPRLRIALVHGCGTLPWTYPRTLRVASMTGGAEADRTDRALRRLWADTLVFAPEHLGLVAHRVGADHLMIGTDDPLMPGQLAAAADEVAEAVRAGALDPAHERGVLGGNALRFLGITHA
ncbi:amidohydrolase family protein [Streptomyces justiciae]|uniref:amidohydrolase family protein n=1 Tax=Streptomyces justiciae TaxID=2780140 RepID=UPI002118BD14|nr:amidohydrolase family protein [Streptomyces justiciae]MCW8379732.1 amidohydrolase [Streptomyces justiciae]